MKLIHKLFIQTEDGKLKGSNIKTYTIHNNDKIYVDGCLFIGTEQELLEKIADSLHAEQMIRKYGVII